MEDGVFIFINLGWSKSRKWAKIDRIVKNGVFRELSNLNISETIRDINLKFCVLSNYTKVNNIHVKF